jgi:hypothetical protein
MVLMKTTIDISDALFQRAKKEARRTGRPMRQLVEQGLRLVLDAEGTSKPYSLPDRSIGNARARSPLDSLSWQDLRNEIYGEK